MTKLCILSGKVHTYLVVCLTHTHTHTHTHACTHAHMHARTHPHTHIIDGIEGIYSRELGIRYFQFEHIVVRNAVVYMSVRGMEV